jgi:molybdopterin-guanine dinucleotide biosynthesis protein A
MSRSSIWDFSIGPSEAFEAMHASRLGNVTGVLLLATSGGSSPVRGRDPAHLERRGEGRFTPVARLLEGLFEETLLVGGDPESEAPGRRVEDFEGPPCALRGLAAALEAASNERVLVVASDLSFLSSDLLLALTSWPEHDAVVVCDACDAGGDHPLCTIYRREVVLPIVREQLASGRLTLDALLARIDSARVTLLTLGLGDLASRTGTNAIAPESMAGFVRKDGC